jgi:hypothetical protein
MLELTSHNNHTLSLSNLQRQFKQSQIISAFLTQEDWSVVREISKPSQCHLSDLSHSHSDTNEQ